MQAEISQTQSKAVRSADLMGGSAYERGLSRQDNLSAIEEGASGALRYAAVLLYYRLRKKHVAGYGL